MKSKANKIKTTTKKNCRASSIKSGKNKMKNSIEKVSVFKIVTDRIIEQLNKGVIPWKQSWAEAGMPRNLISKKNYRGINIWLLASLGYAQNYFLSYKQAIELGGNVKKDERGCPVVFWKWIDRKGTMEGTPKKFPLLRYYTVFNIEQCENIPIQKIPLAQIKQENDTLKSCEDIVSAMPKRPPIKHNEQRAFYNSIGDFVNMPKLETFEDSESYYNTLFHELTHSTGHVNRLNRPEVTEPTHFGSYKYSKEELTAEIGACFLSSLAGIDTKHFDNSVAYIQGWLKKLKDDEKFIVYASTKAQQATDFILDIQFQEKEAIEETQVLTPNEVLA